ncbi:MAG TPA: hypothetical protein VJL61_12860 [Rhodanobacteraceae bacterium]|nr:hypothetical protein [Rhodanobacteraceae bacterium]
MPEAKERPHWKRTLAVLAVMVGGFAFQETGVLPILPNVQRQLPGASTTSSALLVGGIGAQVAAVILKSQAAAGTNTPRESAFTIAFGIRALLAAVGAELTSSVPAGNPRSG